jgi:hypothetical protein
VNEQQEEDGATRALHTNQPKIDELEYFIEGIARMLFGPEAEDYRKLREYVPSSANLSLLIDAARDMGRERDVAEDFGFIFAQLDRNLGERRDDDEPTFNAEVGLFDFEAYLALRDRPASLLEQLEDKQHDALRKLLSDQPEALRALTAAANAYAWFELVGLPDISKEFEPQANRQPQLADDEVRTARGLEQMEASLGLTHEHMPAALARCHYLLHQEYRRQLEALLGMKP